MEDVPLDVMKETLFLLDISDLLHMCQTDFHIYNICNSDEFLFQYLINKRKDIPIDIIRSLRNDYIGYKQLSIELANGAVIPIIINNKSDIFGYKIVDYSKSFNDNFFQMAFDAWKSDKHINLISENWTIYVNILFRSPDYFRTPLRIVSKFVPTGEYSIPVISAEISLDGFRFGIPTDIPMKNISKERFNITDLRFVRIKSW
jgi:hypothetical protein